MEQEHPYSPKDWFFVKKTGEDLSEGGVEALPPPDPTKLPETI